MSKRIPATVPPQNSGALPPPNGYEAQPGYGGDMLSGESPFEETGLDFRRYIAALIRYKWLVIAITVAGTLVGIVATGMMTPVYEAEARLLIETRDRAEARVGAIKPTELFQSNASYIELLYSTDLVMKPVVESLGLYLHGTSSEDSAALASLQVTDRVVPGRYRVVIDDSVQSFVLTREGVDEALQEGTVGDSIGSDLGFAWAPPPEAVTPGQVIEFGIDHPRDMSARLGRSVRSEAEGGGNFLTLTMQGPNPRRITQLLNAVCERFVKVAGDLKVEELQDEIKFLAQQLESAERDLKGKESSLKRLQVETITMPREGTPVAPGVEGTTGPAEEHFFNLKYERESLARDAREIQRVLDQAGGAGIEVGAVGALTFIPSVQKDNDLMAALTELTEKRQELRLLRYDYTDEYPPIRALEQRIAVLERQDVPLLARSLISELEAQEANLGSQIDAVSRELRRIPTVALEESRLERDVSIASGLYTNLQGRYVERVLAARSTSPDVKILDAATMPRAPINGQQGPRLIFVAFMLSLGAGVAAAVLLDKIDPRLRYPEQVSHELGIPILGTVPHAPTRDGRMSELDARPLVEAFRAIRLSLTHVYGTAGPVLITVSSPGADDGKTFVAANLALAFADLGQRTLVIDGDVRRGCLHTRLGGFRKPGLIDYLAGRTTREQIIQSTGYASVDVIASGTRMQNAPELLQSASMSSLIARVRADYDVILIDSPPLAAGIDPMVLGTLAGNLLLVLRTGSTDRELLEAKLDMLAPLPIRLLGAVLNGVQAKGAYRYYSYYYSYLPGYESTDEQEAWINQKQIEGSGPEPAEETATYGQEQGDHYRQEADDSAEEEEEEFEAIRFEFTPVVGIDGIDESDREAYEPTIEVTDFAPGEGGWDGADETRDAADTAQPRAGMTSAEVERRTPFGEDPTEASAAGLDTAAELPAAAAGDPELDEEDDVDPTEMLGSSVVEFAPAASAGPTHDIELERALAASEDEDTKDGAEPDDSQSTAEGRAAVVDDVEPGERDVGDDVAVTAEPTEAAEPAAEAEPAEPVAEAAEEPEAAADVAEPTDDAAAPEAVAASQAEAADAGKAEDEAEPSEPEGAAEVAQPQAEQEAVKPVEAEPDGKRKKGKKKRKRKSKAKTETQDGKREQPKEVTETAAVKAESEPQEEKKSRKKRRSRKKKKKKTETAGT